MFSRSSLIVYLIVLPLYFQVASSLKSIETYLRRFPPCARPCALERAYRSCLTFQDSCPCKSSSIAPRLNECVREACSANSLTLLNVFSQNVCFLVSDYKNKHKHADSIPSDWEVPYSSVPADAAQTISKPGSQTPHGLKLVPSPAGSGRPAEELRSFSAGTSAGIGVGAGILAVVLMGLSFFAFKRYKNRRRSKSPGSISGDSEVTIVAAEKDGSPITELSPDEVRHQMPTGDNTLELENQEKPAQLASAEIHELPS